MPKSPGRKKKIPLPITNAWLKEQTKEALEGQREAFRKKFGHDWQQGDPVFFDPLADKPVPYPVDRMVAQVVEAMRRSGMPPQFIYAYKKTGLLLAEASDPPPHIRKECNDAIAEHFELERKAGRNSDASGNPRSSRGGRNRFPRLPRARH
jgi:hypothetical protein